MDRLTEADARTLRLLTGGPAHELLDRPLRSLLTPLARGWAEAGPVYEHVRPDGRRDRARSVRITEAGHQALAAHERGREP